VAPTHNLDECDPACPENFERSSTSSLVNCTGFIDCARTRPLGLQVSRWDRSRRRVPTDAWAYSMFVAVHGWCSDVWHISLLLPPTDGSAWIQGGDDKFANGPRRLLVPSLCLSSGVRNLRFPVGHNVIGRRRRTGLFRLGSRTAHQVWAKTEAGGAPSARSRPYGS
jgi:hypothetical protein